MNIGFYLCMLFLLLGISIAGAADKFVEVHGFVDPQFHASSDPGATQGFILNDSAIMLSKEISNASFQLDLPFYGSPVAFNPLKAQAYVGYKHNERLSWKLGKFDAPIGVESNKATQIEFTRQGLTYALLPTSLTGAIVTVAFGSYQSISLIAADPTNLDSLTGGKYDFGVRADHGTDAVKFWIVALYNADSSVGTVFDLGTTFQTSTLFKLDLGLSYFLSNGTHYWGAIAKPIFSISAIVNFGARLEYSDGLSGATLQATLGPQLRMSEDLKMKLDYTFNRSTLSGQSHTATHSGVLAAVFEI